MSRLEKHAAATGWGIGSDFETVDADFMLESESNPPWETGEDILYTETARQALHLLGAELSARGYHRLIVPGYLCDSMLQPFLRHFDDIIAAKYGVDLRTDVADLVALGERMDEPFVVLSATYFGAAPDARHREALNILRAQGAFIIEDETHRPFSPAPSSADVVFCSLRKLLPVADGAYLRGSIVSSLGPIAEPHEVCSRWDAMDEKRRFIAGETSSNHYRDLFASSNAELETASEARRPSPRSLATLRKLDYSGLAQARKSNGSALRDALQEFSNIRVGGQATDNDVPAYITVRVSDARNVQKHLAVKQIFCPIHWPKPDYFGPVAWPNDILSIPIDHRYDSSDMRRVAETVGVLADR